VSLEQDPTLGTLVSARVEVNRLRGVLGKASMD
jgi:hypothetical protein